MSEYKIDQYVKSTAKKLKDQGAAPSSDLLSDALNKLKTDPRVYKVIHDDFKLSYAQTKVALAPLLDYQKDLDQCENCLGYDQCQKLMPHYQMYLTYEDGLVEPKFRLCDLAKKQEAYTKSFLRRDFPLDWMDMTVQHDVSRTAKKIPAMKVCADLLLGHSSRWLYVEGTRRSGRTFMLACLCNDFVNKGISPVAFCDTALFLKWLQDLNIRDKARFDLEFEKYQNCAVLVLDDFGNENKDKTGYGYSNILYPLLNERAKRGLITCFSSDFSIQEIASMYQYTIGPARARQLENLLLDLCEKEFDISSLDLSGSSRRR